MDKNVKFMSTSIQQRVMHYAHHIHNTTTGSWSQALRQAWEIHYLRHLLARGVVEFTYIKQDGTTRTARGTNYGEIIPPSKMPSGALARKIALGQAEPNYCSIPYYDLDREAWRAFSIENFVQVTRVAAITPIQC